MKRLILNVFKLLIYPIAIIWNAKVSSLYFRMIDKIYSIIIQRRFKTAKNLRVCGRPLIISGAEHIEVGENVEISRLARIDAVTNYKATNQTFTPKLKIGNNAVIQVSCHIGCINRVEIGNYAAIGARTYITDHTHGNTTREELEIPSRMRPLYSKGPVIIGDCVAIGEGCAIMPGVTIGEHSVIGANSVVTKDIPPYCIAGGNPAKVLKVISKD